MNHWPGDNANLLNSYNAGGFHPSNDPSMAYLSQSNAINPAQFQNPQQFLNGGARNPSPGYHNPMYQVGSVIPSKRPRDSQDSMGTSPHQVPGGLPGSRSQTPAQNPYPNYPHAPNGTPHFTQPPTPFQHLQGPPSNASGSPVPGNQPFNPANNIQRVQTASPSPFSPHGAPQMSPAHTDHPSRTSTPHDAVPGFMPGAQFPLQGLGQQHFHNPQTMAGHGAPMPGAPSFNHMAPQMPSRGMTPQNQAQAYQMHLQNQARQMQAQAGQIRPPGGGGMAAVPGMTNPAAMQAKQQEMNMIKTLQQFAAQRGAQLEWNPVIQGQQISSFLLFNTVIRNGGSAKMAGKWPLIAQMLKYPQQLQMQAGREIEHYWKRTLAMYEMAAAQRAQNRDPTRGMMPRQDDQMPNQSHMSPGQQNLQTHQPQPPDSAKPQNEQSNGFITPVQVKESPSNQAQHRPSLPRSVDGSQPNGMPGQGPVPSPAKRTENEQGKPRDETPRKPRRESIEDPFKPEVLPESHYHGPVNVEEVYSISSHIIDLKPIMPSFRELGVVDLHALTMSLKSGIHAEVRMALDTLCLLSVEPNVQLVLEQCEDLVDALVDCGQDQVDKLAEDATEVSDEMLIDSYEDIVRGCTSDARGLQDVPEIGSRAYNLDRAVDKLICVTTILRNFSFYESNFSVLGTPEVIGLMTTVIRYLGTRSLLLRSNVNTLDFMKDIISFLSNLGQQLQLPSKEDALCILHFLLAFAPGPSPVSSSRQARVTFAPYNPNVHKYLPSAVDSLAKLLARDEPNRTYFKSIFAADASSSPPFELLTRTFGLAVSPVPEVGRHIQGIVKARRPTLLQGMLAAEILTGLIPSSDHGLARSWLESADGVCMSIRQVVSVLLNDMAKMAPQARERQYREDYTDYLALSHRGLEVLRRLAERCKNEIVNDGETTNGEVNGEEDKTGKIKEKGRVPGKVVIAPEQVLGAMMINGFDARSLRELCVFADLDS
ncbi:MAG: hypothetical protein Q9227_009129 [Pyrenula ochraceoflavens]